MWPMIVRSGALTKTVTDVDAKYSITNLDVGSYVVYAQSSTAVSFIEWFIPVNIAANQKVKLDLFNDNAKLIVNRKD